MLVRSAWPGPPGLASKLALAETPAQPHFAPLQEKKTSGTEVRRTPDVILRFVGFNFGHVQLLMLVVVMSRSYAFCHLSHLMQIELTIININLNLCCSVLFIAVFL